MGIDTQESVSLSTLISRSQKKKESANEQTVKYGGEIDKKKEQGVCRSEIKKQSQFIGSMIINIKNRRIQFCIDSQGFNTTKI